MLLKLAGNQMLWQTKPIQELNYENLKTQLGLYILEIEVKGKAQETV